MTDLGPAGSAFDRYEQHLIAGGELLRQSRLDDAQRELLAALDDNPEGHKALALLGLAYFRGGKFAEALPVYRRLVGLTPTDASHQLNLGLVLLKLGDAGGAASALEKSRDLDPSQGRAVSYLGLAYARGGRFPINPSGGLIGGGHPVGATGVRMVLDASRQVAGRAGDYQIDGARRFATLNLGGSGTTACAFVLGGAA